MKTTLLLGTVVLISSSAIVFAGGGAAKAGANANRLAMVTYWGDDRVALIDTQGEPGKEEVWSIDTLKSGCAKPYDVRVNRKGSHAFATCSGNNKVIVIDIVAQMIEHVIEVGASPRDLQLYNDDNRLIVASSGNDTVSIIDVPTSRVLYSVPVSLQPYGVAVVNEGKTAIVTGWASGDVHFLELGPNSGKVVRSVKVGLLPYTVVAAPDGNVAYVAANGNHAVVSLDIPSGKVLSSTPVGRNPWSLALNPSTDSLLVTNNRSNNLTLLRTGTASANSLITTATISAGADDRTGVSLRRAGKNVTISSDGKIGVFTDLANNQVVVIDVPSGDIKKVIDVGKAPYGIEFFRPSI